MKLKGIAATTGIGTIYRLIFAALVLAPLPQTSSQSEVDSLDILEEFPISDIEYDIFPAKTPEWMRGRLLPTLAPVHCSHITWLSWPTYSQNYEGERHSNYFCDGNFRAFASCIKQAEDDHYTAIKNAMIDKYNCLEKAKNTTFACLAACALSGPLMIKCTGICTATGIGLIANCKSDYNAAIEKINNNADAAMEKCIEKYKTDIL